jgi:hypothetical protein
MQYVTANSEYQYCNDSNTWISMTATTTAGAACTKVGMIVGDKYCNGVNYFSLDSQDLLGGACSTNNTYKYFSGSMHICVSGQWHPTGFCSTCGGGGGGGGPFVPGCAAYTKFFQCVSDLSCEWDGVNCNDIASTWDPPPPPPPSDDS